MATNPKIEFYTLKALAEKEGVTEDYLRKLMVRLRRGELRQWRGYCFVPMGNTQRSIWLAYEQGTTVVVHGTAIAKSQNREKARRRRLAKQIMGKYAHLPISSDEFIQFKREELAREKF